MSKPPCSVVGCEKLAGGGRGWCQMHYMRWWKHGDVGGAELERFSDPKRKFWRSIEFTPTCWVWTAAHDPKGYGVLRVNGKVTGAHRFAYELLVGPIPAGLSIDHLCRNPTCVNPTHLEPVTHRENMARGDIWKRKTHCVNGHERTPENVNASRGCVICDRIRSRDYQRRRRARLVAQAGGGGRT